MEKEIAKKRMIYSLLVPLLFVLVLWIIKAVEISFGVDFGNYGIFPRKLVGLRGILFMPFIHGSWSHLIANSFPLLVLGWALYYFYKNIANRVVFWSFLMAGFYIWISARASFHIGASGLVYSLFGFLLASGFIRRHIPLIALSFFVAFSYGSLVWGIFPWKPEVSWEGHFWGLFAGVVLAFFYRKQGPQRKVYEWDEEDEEEDEDDELEPPSQDSMKVVYHFVPAKKKD